MSNQYRKKPVVINAFRLGYDNMPDWFMDKLTANDVTIHNTDGRWRGGPDYALIKTLEGEMRAEFGDYIIQGVKGELYPCKPDIFATTYESAATVAERDPWEHPLPVHPPKPKAATVAEPSEHKDSTPQLHVGDSFFESWFADYTKPPINGYKNSSVKQWMRDAYAAGMGDPLVVARKAAQQQAEQESVIKRQAQKIGELIAERDSWIEAHARLYRLYHDQSPKAGEEIHVNVEGGDVYTLPLQLSGMDKPRFVVHVPCSPQAEPRADERAAFEAWASKRRMDLRREANNPDEYLLASTADACVGWLARAAQSGERAGVALLADEHKGMRVDYQGLFKQARAGLRREPFLAEMLRQFQDHVTELGRRWYAGDTAVVDELLQLYCVEREARAAIAVTSANLEGQSNG